LSHFSPISTLGNSAVDEHRMLGFIHAIYFGAVVAAKRGSGDAEFLLNIVLVIIGLLALAAGLKAIADLVGISKRAVLYEKKARIAQGSLKLLEGESTLRDSLVAQAYADFFYLRDLDTALYLETKRRPAPTAANEVRRIAAERRQVEKVSRLFQLQVETYESLFPWLKDFKEEEFDELVKQLREAQPSEETDDDEDPALKWVPEAKYKKMSRAEANQLALDRYWQKTKTSWELGRDYERYVGYQYETEGWKVNYQGIIEGFDDLGRDIIASRGTNVEIVQCKYWSQHKEIHEKHLFQLFGTSTAYRLDHPSSKVCATFVTSTKLTERARQFAKALDITVRESYSLTRYPCIKCNIGRNGTKIYHLPFDQQYDRTVIECSRGECYKDSVKSAEASGFRRAFRWTGLQSE
jgi:hypothetical protein